MKQGDYFISKGVSSDESDRPRDEEGNKMKAHHLCQVKALSDTYIVCVYYRNLSLKKDYKLNLEELEEIIEGGSAAMATPKDLIAFRMRGVL